MRKDCRFLAGFCLVCLLHFPLIHKNAFAQDSLFTVTDKLILRDDPDSKSKKILTINPGKWILIEKQRLGKWIKLETPEGASGWTDKKRNLISVPRLTDAEGQIPVLPGTPESVIPRILAQPLPRRGQGPYQSQGEVFIVVVIEKDGKIGNRAILKSSGDTVFDHESIQVLDKWQFAPPLLHNNPVSMLAIVQTSFRIFP